MAARRALSTPTSRIASERSLPAMCILRLAARLFIAILCAGSACAETARITFVLVNDIYLLADQMMPDGSRHGGSPGLTALSRPSAPRDAAGTGGEKYRRRISPPAARLR